MIKEPYVFIKASVRATGEVIKVRSNPVVVTGFEPEWVDDSGRFRFEADLEFLEEDE